MCQQWFGVVIWSFSESAITLNPFNHLWGKCILRCWQQKWWRFQWDLNMLNLYSSLCLMWPRMRMRFWLVWLRKVNAKWARKNWPLDSLSWGWVEKTCGFSIITWNRWTFFVELCFIYSNGLMWFSCPYSSGLLHWHLGNHVIAPVPVKQPWRIWVKRTGTKHSKCK